MYKLEKQEKQMNLINVNNEIDDSINHLKENHVQLSKEVLELIRLLEDKYRNLVWSSRKPVTGGPGKITIEDINSMYSDRDSKPTQKTIDKITSSVTEIFEQFPAEVLGLHGIVSYGKYGDVHDPSVGDWTHGFNSGMLGCLRMLSDITHQYESVRSGVDVNKPDLNS